MLFGFFKPLRMRTPWFASKYGAENDTTFAREAVIVTSSNAKSNFFEAGEKSPLKGARRYWTLLIPSFFAIACDSAHSKPDGFLIVVPVGLPFQNAGAGTSKPTMSFPGCFVGTASGLAPAAVVTAKTDSSLLEFLKELRRIRDEPVPDAELAKAKAYITLGLPGDFETAAGAASKFRELLVYDLPLDYFDHYVARINAVTAADVQRVARQYIDPDHFDIVVVGDKSQIEAGIKALNEGPIVYRDLWGQEVK